MKLSTAGSRPRERHLFNLHACMSYTEIRPAISTLPPWPLPPKNTQYEKPAPSSRTPVTTPTTTAPIRMDVTPPSSSDNGPVTHSSCEASASSCEVGLGAAEGLPVSLKVVSDNSSVTPISCRETPSLLLRHTSGAHVDVRYSQLRV